MNAAVEQSSSDKTDVRPFRVDVPEAELSDLRRRIKTTRCLRRNRSMTWRKGCRAQRSRTSREGFKSLST